MAKPASPTSTEGFGFTYADKVAAVCLVALLRKGALGGTDLGGVVKVSFGQRPAGWHFDDVLLTLDDAGRARTLALSIKSSAHVSASGVNGEIVDLVWEQLEGGGPFAEGSDVLALAQPSPPADMRATLAELTRWAVLQEAGQTEDWVGQPGVGNEIKRSLVGSVKRAAPLDDAQRFLRSFRVLTFDVDPPYDADSGEARQNCLGLLLNPTEADADLLWTRLCQIAADYRGSAGTLDLATLIREIGRGLALRPHPMVDADLERLRGFSASRHLPTVRDTIGDDLRLPTASSVGRLRDALDEHGAVFFVGQSGTGKSVVLKHLAESAPENEFILYLRADLDSVGPTALGRTVGLAYDVPAILEYGRFARSTIVVDQVDRLLTDAQVADLTELLVATRPLGASVRFVFGCQSAEAERVISRLKAALPDGTTGRITHEPDDEAAYDEVIRRYPSLRGIAFRRELRPLFVRPKNLDLLVCRLDQLGALTGQEIVSQKQFIDWFWSAYIDVGEDGLARSTAAQELAQLQARELTAALPPSMASDRSALDSLRLSGVVVGDDRGVSFQHDLYGDWARLRAIEAARGSVVAFILERGTNPLWLRAVRLWSATLLEIEGAQAWNSAFGQFAEREGAGWMVRDAMLDGLSLAAGAHQYLTDLAPVLMAGEGELLDRFLARFLFATTTPDDRLASSFAQGDPAQLTALRAQLRVPQWYLWLPVVRFLSENAPACCSKAPKLTVEVLFQWLGASPGGMPYGEEASAMALSIAEGFVGPKDYLAREDEDYGRRLFRCSFLALRYLPDRARAFLLRASGRTAEDPYPGAETVDGARYAKASSPYGSTKARILGPWPSGPVGKANEALREFVLLGGGVGDAFAFSPAFAREILLSCVIDGPHLEDPDSFRDRIFMEETVSVSRSRTFRPPFHDKGLFALIFSLDADWAVSLVEEIVTFASERWEETMRSEGGKAGLRIGVKGQKRVLRGDASCYGWHRDGTHCPDLVVSSLMALEKHLYALCDDGTEGDLLDMLVRDLRSVAMLGLLVTIGKRTPRLFAGALRFTHFNQLVQWWDIDQTVRGEGHQLISWMGEGEKRTEAAREWHVREYRRSPLKLFAFYVLSDPEGRSEAGEASARWARMARRCADDRKGSLENLAAVYDIRNYTAEERDGGILIRCNLPGELQRRADDAMRESQRSVLPMMLANKARRILSGEAGLADERPEDLLLSARSEDLDGEPSSDFMRAEDARCGIAAVLILKHAGWLGLNPDAKDWCVETIVGTTSNPPSPSQYEVDTSVSEDQWCHFAAQALPSIWAERPDDRRVRTGMANLIEDFRYNTVRYLAKPIFALRSVRPDLYMQAIRLHRSFSAEVMLRREAERAAMYAGFRAAPGPAPLPPSGLARARLLAAGALKAVRAALAKLGSKQQSRLATEVASYDRERERFISGRMEAEMPTLPDPVSPRRTDGAPSSRYHRDRARPLVDTFRLGCFVSNLPGLRSSTESGERTEIVARWRELFDEMIAEILGGQGEEGASVETYRGEQDLFTRFGRLTADLEGQEDPVHFLSALKAMLPVAERLAEDFLEGLIERTLEREGEGAFGAENWLCAVQCLLGSKEPKPGDWQQDYGWHEWYQWLMGNTSMMRRFTWKPEHSAFVARNRVVYDSWVRAMCAGSRRLSHCLLFLASPAAEAIRADACRWIDEGFDDSMLDGDRDHLSENMADFLESARPQIIAARTAQPDLFKSYINLLSALNRRNIRLAMQLMEDVSTLG